MKKDFVEYLPYIVVTLLVISGVAIYERGGFEKEKALHTSTPVATPQAISPTDSPTPTAASTSTPIPQVSPTPTNIIPSINRNSGGDD